MEIRKFSSLNWRWGDGFRKIDRKFQRRRDLHAIADEYNTQYLSVLVSVPMGFVFTDFWHLASCRSQFKRSSCDVGEETWDLVRRPVLLPAVCTWADYLTSLKSHFLNYKRGTILINLVKWHCIKTVQFVKYETRNGCTFHLAQCLEHFCSSC